MLIITRNKILAYKEQFNLFKKHNEGLITAIFCQFYYEVWNSSKSIKNPLQIRLNHLCTDSSRSQKENPK